MQDDVERLLAQLFVNESLRERFYLDPMQVARQYDLSPAECEAIAKIPQADLRRAARSYERKRNSKPMLTNLARLGRWMSRIFAAMK
jgi:hypothetical protein